MNVHRAAIGLIAVCISQTAVQDATAQSFTGVPAVDSAAVARTAWAAAVRATRQQDFATASAQAQRAASAWPSEPAYIWGAAVFAARHGQSEDVRRALTAFAGLGLGRDHLGDSVFARYRAEPWFGELSRQHAANRRPLARSTVVRTLSDSTQFPEGVDYDARTRKYYVTSIRHGTIVEVGPKGAERELWPRSRRMGGVLAVRVDARRGVLWATVSGLTQTEGYTAADSGIGALLQVRIADGTVIKRWDLKQGRHVLGDVALGPNGDVFISDSFEPVLYRLRSERDTLEALRHPLFRSLQGIAPSNDGRTIYVADYSHGLLRVDLATNAVSRIEHSPDVTTVGCDGIVWYDGSVIAIQNGVAPARVMRFELDRSGSRVTSARIIDRNSTIADEPTIGTIVGDAFVYVANSQWEKYGEDGSRIRGTALARPILLSVPLRNGVR